MFLLMSSDIKNPFRRTVFCLPDIQCKMLFSLSIDIFVSFLIIVQVIGIPLPSRESQGYNGLPQRLGEPPVIHRANVPYNQKQQPPPEVHQRFKRQKDTPNLFHPNQNQGQQQGQRRHPYDKPTSQSSQQNKQTEPYPWESRPLQYHNNINHKSGFGYEDNNNAHNNNAHNPQHRRRRDVPQKVQIHDWQMPLEEQVNPNSFEDGYCKSPECMSRMPRNNIRNDYNNGHKATANNPTNVHPQGLRHENFGHKIPLPSQTVMPPPPSPLPHLPPSKPPMRQNEEEQFSPYPDSDREQYHEENSPVDQFYEYRSLMDENSANYPNSQGQHEQFNPSVFLFDDPPLLPSQKPSNSNKPNILTVRSNGIAFVGNVDIVRVVLDVSDGDEYNEDDDETHLEVEDQ